MEQSERTTLCRAESQQLDVSISAYLSDIIENFYDTALSRCLERETASSRKREQARGRAGVGVIGVRGC